jgi:tetratricopeptide (TPR) repeat protein
LWTLNRLQEPRKVQQGEVQEAIAQYQAALRIRPDYADAETNLANALLQNGQTEDAIAHHNLAVAFHRQGRLAEAVAHYRKALAIDPGYPDVHYNLGRALLQNGETEEGRHHLEMRQNPQK